MPKKKCETEQFEQAEAEEKPTHMLSFFQKVVVDLTEEDYRAQMHEDASCIFRHSTLLQDKYKAVCNKMSYSIDSAPTFMLDTFTFFYLYILQQDFSFQNAKEFKEVLINNLHRTLSSQETVIECKIDAFIEGCTKALVEFKKDVNRKQLKSLDDFKQDYDNQYDAFVKNIQSLHQAVSIFSMTSVRNILNNAPGLINQLTIFLKTETKAFYLYEVSTASLQDNVTTLKQRYAEIKSIVLNKTPYSREQQLNDIEDFAERLLATLASLEKLQPEKWSFKEALQKVMATVDDLPVSQTLLPSSSSDELVFSMESSPSPRH